MTHYSVRMHGLLAIQNGIPEIGIRSREAGLEGLPEDWTTLSRVGRAVDLSRRSIHIHGKIGK